MHKRMDNLSENFGKIKVGPAVPPKPKKQQPQVPKSCNVKQVSQPSYSTVLQRQFNDGSHVYSNEMLQGGPRTMTLDNSIDLQHQKEVLEYKKKMLDNMRGEKIYENQNNMYENMKHYPEESAYANIGNKNLIYSNLMSHDERQNDLPPPPMVPLTLNEMSLSGNDDEFPPPPSPVSSSYSELRRATDSCPKPPPQYNNPALPYSNIMHQNASIYANNMHQPTYGTYGISSQNFNVDYSDYTPSQGSTTYESIYEPINPRPNSQLSSRSNYSLYTPYVSANSQGSVMSGNSMNNQKMMMPKSESEVDTLTDLLVQSMDGNQDSDTYGTCVKCGERVVGESSGCTAMEQIYHIVCFTCAQCQINLQGKPFYALDGKPYCEEDYLNTLEKCCVCLEPILERILRATGKPYHPQCFTCIICGKSLDGIPFTVDATNQIHCIEDFHKKFAPRCCVCRMPIMPENGEDETVRVVALDRSFHINCYKCEDCGILLSSEAEGRGCYPLDDHILCKSCNAKRVQALTSHMTTEL